jgi:hypothetical protein
MRRGLEILERSLGEKNPITATARANLAIAYYQTGETEKAVVMIERSKKARSARGSKRWTRDQLHER